MCVFSMTWQPPALFKHGVGCAGSLIVRLGLPVVHAVPGTLWRGKEGAQQGQAASNTSPTEPKASGGALNTRTGPGRNDNEDQDCVIQDNMSGQRFKPHTHTMTQTCKYRNICTEACLLIFRLAGMQTIKTRNVFQEKTSSKNVQLLLCCHVCLLVIMIEIYVFFALWGFTWHSGSYGQSCDIFFLESCVDEDLVLVDNW